jgi:hypothetical protein
MGAFYVSAGIQFASILFLGLPIALALIASDRSRYASGWLLLSPALGATVYFSAGTILHSFGLKSAAVFWGWSAWRLLSSPHILPCETPSLARYARQIAKQ